MPPPTTDVLAVSGASAPACLVRRGDSLVARFAAMEELHIAIAPGQRAPRGPATLTSGARLLRQAVQMVEWRCVAGRVGMAGGGSPALRRPRQALGRRLRCARSRLVAGALSRLEGVGDSGSIGDWHPALRAVAGHRRPSAWSPAAARAMGRASGSHRRYIRPDSAGITVGVLLRATGRAHSGERLQIDWHLTVDALHDPDRLLRGDPSLAERLARGSIAARGAFACMGLLGLPDCPAGL